MAQTKSLNKVIEFLKAQKEPVTTTTIVMGTQLHFRSVKGCIGVLATLDKVDLMTNGRTTLIKFKE